MSMIVSSRPELISIISAFRIENVTAEPIGVIDFILGTNLLKHADFHRAIPLMHLMPYKAERRILGLGLAQKRGCQKFLEHVRI